MRLEMDSVRTMARKLRIQYPGALYHAINRGIDRRPLFQDERDYMAFLKDREAERRLEVAGTWRRKGARIERLLNERESP